MSLLPAPSGSLEEIRAANVAADVSIGMFRPKAIRRLAKEHADPWTEKERSALRQERLGLGEAETRELSELEQIPWKFSYEFEWIVRRGSPRSKPRSVGFASTRRLCPPIVAALAQADHAIVSIDGGRVERRRRELAFDVAAGRISERAFLAAMRRLSEEHAALTDYLPRTSIDGGRAVEYIRTFAASWAKAKPPTRARMIQSVYEEIVVRGEEFVSVRLTPDAYAHGLALALPAEVVVPALPTWGGPRRGSNMALARPTGVGRALAAYAIPIEGRGEWLAAARRLVQGPVDLRAGDSS